MVFVSKLAEPSLFAGWRNGSPAPNSPPPRGGMFGTLGELTTPSSYDSALAQWPLVQDKPYYLEFFASADFGEQLQKPYWTIKDSVPILLGIEPNFAQPQDLEANRYRDDIATEGMRLRRLVLMAQEVGDLPERFRPVQFINWALAQHIEVPVGLIEIAVERSLPVRGCIHPAEKARRELLANAKSALQAKQLEIEALQLVVAAREEEVETFRWAVAERDKQIEAAEAKVVDLEAANSSWQAKLDRCTSAQSQDETGRTKGGITRKYNSACKALFGLSKLHYDIDPTLPQGLKCTAIVSALAEVDVKIDDETLRNHLTAGSDQASK